MGSTLRALIKLALVVLVVHAGVKIVPVFWNHFRFRDACQEIARFAAKLPEAEILDRVMAKAEQFGVPVARDAVTVQKQGTLTRISASYTADLEYFPGRFHPYEFVFTVAERPPAYAEYVP